MYNDIWFEEKLVASISSEIELFQVVWCVNCDGSAKHTHVLLEGVTSEDDRVRWIGDQDG